MRFAKLAGFSEDRAFAGTITLPLHGERRFIDFTVGQRRPPGGDRGRFASIGVQQGFDNEGVGAARIVTFADGRAELGGGWDQSGTYGAALIGSVAIGTRISIADGLHIGAFVEPGLGVSATDARYDNSAVHPHMGGGLVLTAGRMMFHAGVHHTLAATEDDVAVGIGASLNLAVNRRGLRLRALLDR